MADNNQILLDLGFNQAKTEAALKQLAAQIKLTLSKSLKELDIRKTMGLDKAIKVEVSFNKAATKRNWDDLKNSLTQFKVPIVFNFAQAKRDLLAFQAGLPPLKLNVQVGAATGSASQTPAGPPVPPSIAAANAAAAAQSAVGNFNNFGSSLDQTKQKIDAIKKSLIDSGLKTKEAEKEVNGLTGAYKRLASSFDRIDSAIKSGKGTAQDFQQRIKTLNVDLNKLDANINNFSTSASKANVATQRGVHFMESFGFKVGILGFGMGILGGHLQRLTQGLVQFTTAAAKAVEPLERIQNLVVQLVESGDIPAEDKGTIFGEINRLADLPGSNLESVTEGFRKLLVVTQDVQKSLRLVEELTKATGRSGTGARGLGQLIFQLAQFAESGEFIQRDIKTIKEQGGADVSNIVNRLGGKEGIQELGPEKFFDELIKGLEKVPAPLEAAQDKLNKIDNSLIRIRLNILEFIKPGLDNLLVGLQKLEVVVGNIKAQFDVLSPATKSFIGNLLTGTVALTGALAGVLTALAGVAIALATANHLIESLGIATGKITITGVANLINLVPRLLAYITPITAAIVAVIGVLSKAFSSNAGGFYDALSYLASTILPTLWNVLKAIFNTGKALVEIFVNAYNLVDDILGGGLTEFVGTVGSALAYILATLVQTLNLLSAIPAILQFIADILSGDVALAFEKMTLSALKIAKSIGAVGAIMQAVFGVNLQEEIEASEAEIARLEQTAGKTNDTMKSGADAVAESQTALNKAFDETQKTIAVITEAIKKQTEAIEKNTFETQQNVIAKRAEASSRAFGTDAFDEAFQKRDLTDPVEQEAARKDLSFITASEETAARIKQDAEVQVKIRKALEESRNKFFELSQKEIKTGTKQIYKTLSDTLKAVLDSGAQLDQATLEKTIFTQIGKDIVRVFSPSENDLARIKYDIAKNQEDIDKLIAGIAKANKNRDIELANQLNLQLKSAKQTRQVLLDRLPKSTSELNELQQQIANEKHIISEAVKDANATTDILSKAQEETAKKRAKLERDIQAAEREKQEQLAEDARKRPILGDLVLARASSEEFERLRKELTEDIDQVNSIAELRGRMTKAVEALNDAAKLEFIQEAKLIEAGREKFGEKLQKQRDSDTRYFERLQEIRVASDEQLKQFISDVVGDARENSKRVRTLLTTFGDELKDTINDMVALIAAGADPNFKKIKELTESFNKVIIDTANSLSSGSVKPLIRAHSAMQELGNAIEKQPLGDDQKRALKDYFEFINQFQEGVGSLSTDRPLGKDEIDRLLTQAEGIVTFLQTILLGTKDKDAAADVSLVLTKVLRAVEIWKDVKKTLRDTVDVDTTKLEAEAAQIKANIKLLELEDELVRKRTENKIKAGQGPGGVPFFDQKVINDALDDEIGLINEKYLATVNGIEQERKARLKEAEDRKASKKDLAEINEYYDHQLELLRLIKDEDEAAAKLDATTAAINGLRDAVEGLTSVSATFAKFTDALRAFITGLQKDGKLVVDFSKLVEAGVMAIGAAFATAISESLANGEGFLTTMKKFMGQLLIQVGTMLVQLGTASLALAALSVFFPQITPPSWKLGVPAAIAAIAGGAALIAAGALLGGGSSAAASTANTSATNTANSQTGATGETFDPYKDPKTIYQKALMANILIDIRTDDTQIVKTVIKHVNGNGRLATLIGNRKLQFGY